MSDKSNAVTDDEFVETDELLASIPVEAEAMDLAEADGFMTAVQLLPKTPETKDWLPHILSTVGAKDAGTGNAASDKRLRALLLKRFHQIGDQLAQAVPLDPVYLLHWVFWKPRKPGPVFWILIHALLLALCTAFCVIFPKKH